VHVAADHHEMHHREDARGLGEFALDRARVREQRRDVGMRDRVLRAHDHVDLAVGEEFAQGASLRVALDLDRLQ
jgi:hypothetical protein